MKQRFQMLCAALAAALLAGCSSLRYGDGKAGPVPLNPVVEKVAAAADAKAPGSGDALRKWFSEATRQRVPAGYVVVVDHFLDGQLIDPSRIVPVPRLAPAGAAPVVVVTPASNAVPSTLPPEVNALLDQIAGGVAP